MRNARKFLASLRSIQLTEAEKEALHPRNFGVIKESAARLLESMDEKTFFTSAEAIRLAPHERVAIREALFERANAVPFWALRFKNFSTITAAVLTLTVTGSGLSYAAENTVPGDVLYPVKIYVNEEMTSRFLMRSSESKAQWEAKRAERRLKEAETLSAGGNTNSSAMSKLEDSFQRHASEVQEHMVVLRNEQKSAELETLATTFNAALKVRTQELKQGESSDMVAPLLRRVHSARVGMKEVELEHADAQETAAASPTLMLEAPARVNKRAVLDMGLIMESDAPAAANVGREEDEEDEEVNARAASVRMGMEAVTLMQNARPNNESDDEAIIEAEARMNMVRRKMQNMQAEFPSADAALLSSPINIRLQQTKKLLDQATKEMDAGNIPKANVNASAALEQVRVIEQQMKTAQPVPSSAVRRSTSSSARSRATAPSTSVDGSLKTQ